MKLKFNKKQQVLSRIKLLTYHSIYGVHVCCAFVIGKMNVVECVEFLSGVLNNNKLAYKY